MVYKRYYSPFEDNNANSNLSRHTIYEKKKEIVEEKCPPTPIKVDKSPFGFFDKIGIDDIIIIGVIIILLMEDKDNRDIPLILALGFLFLIQYIEAD